MVVYMPGGGEIRRLFSFAGTYRFSHTKVSEKKGKTVMKTERIYCQPGTAVRINRRKPHTDRPPGRMKRKQVSDRIAGSPS